MGIRGIKKAKKPPTIADLNRLTKELQSVTVRLESREREFLQAQEQQAATSEILRVISSTDGPTASAEMWSPRMPLDCLTHSDAIICLVEDNVLRLSARHGPVPRALAQDRLIDDPASGNISRAMIDRRVDSHP